MALAFGRRGPVRMSAWLWILIGFGIVYAMLLVLLWSFFAINHGEDDFE